MIQIKITGSGNLRDLAEELEQLQNFIADLTNTEAETGGTFELPNLILEYSEGEEEQNYCIIRKDLQDEFYSIPAGDSFIEFTDESQRIPYRWINEGTDKEQFQVFFNDKWLEAQSIDFDFPS